jgi:hypothetical protein
MASECKEQQKKIAQSFLGDLTAAEQQLLDDHLSACPICRSEQASLAQTLNLLQSSIDESVPRHFFVQPQERELSPWQIFQQMKPRWQVMTAVFAGLFILIGIAAAFRMQIRTVPGGWSMSFGREDFDIAVLKEDILKAAEQKNREADSAWIQQVRAEIARSGSELSQKQQASITIALSRLDARIKGKVTQSEDRMRADTQRLAVSLYQTVAQQRAQDLNLINTRFDTLEAADVIKARQTDDILSTLLQVAELRLR